MSAALADKIEATARALLGEPNARLSTRDELRFGSNGSLAVHVRGDHAGTWRDHEAGAGGGVLDLIAHKLGGDRQSAAGWLRDNVEGGEAPANDAGRVVATYRYESEWGELVHEVLRLEPKSFRQRRPDGTGGWLWNMKGVPPVLYNLPRVREAAQRGELVIVVEGEKDADRLNALGLVATCNAGGAGKFKPEHAAQLAGARVAVIPDNDETGRQHAESVAAAVKAHAAETKLVELGVDTRKGDASDWLDAGGTADRLCDLIEQAPTWRQAFKPRFPVVWFGREDEGEPLRWLVRDLLVQGGLSVFYGAPKSTKTFAALDLAFNIAHGRDWFGMRTRRGGVVYVCGEGQPGVRNRMKAWRQQFDGSPDAPFVMIPQSVNLFDDPDEVDRLIADILGISDPMGCKVELVCFDTFSRMVGSGDEDRARDVNVVVRTGERIQRATGAHVMIIHHTGKDRERGMRGSNALLGAVDAAVEVVKDDDTGLCSAKVTAIKDGEPKGPFDYKLRQTAVGVDDEGEDIIACVIDPAGARQGTIAQRLSEPERRCLSVLRELVRDNRDKPGQTGFVPIATWRDKFRDSESGSFEARKKRAERATKSLIDKEFVEAWGDNVCLPGDEE
jgi:hypothetical protein